MPFIGTSDVAEAAKTDSATIRNGSVVVGVRPNGGYTVDSERAVGGPAATAIETKLASSFDDPAYYNSHNSLLTGLVAWYKFNEPSNAIRQNSVSDTLDLTDNNTVATVAGFIENGAQFIAANNEYLSLSESEASEFDVPIFSVSFWINFDSIASTSDIFVMWGPLLGGTKHKFYIQHYRSGGTSEIRFVSSSDGIIIDTQSGSASISASQWYHIACVFDGTNKIIYINGSPDATVAASILSSSGAPFRLPGPAFVDGKIDELGFWSKGLTADEITSLYNNGAGATYPGF